jgi:hypothetical protein
MAAAKNVSAHTLSINAGKAALSASESLLLKPGKKNAEFRCAGLKEGFSALLDGDYNTNAPRAAAAVTLLRDHLGMEAAIWSPAFSTFTGTLDNVADLSIMHGNVYDWALALQSAARDMAYAAKDDAAIKQCAANGDALRKAKLADHRKEEAKQFVRKVRAAMIPFLSVVNAKFEKRAAKLAKQIV